MGNQCFSFIACSLLGILFIYGIVGIVLNAQDLAFTEGHGAWPYNQNPAHGALIIIQSLYMVTMILGVLGHWRQERTFYFWAAFLLLGIFISLLVFGVVCLRSSLKDMTGDIFNTLKKYKRGQFEEIDWFFMLQHKYKCCGVSSFYDWGILKIGLMEYSVPRTCCLREHSLPKLDCGVDVLKMEFKDIQSLIYIDPCGPILSPMIRSKAMYLGLEMLVAAFASIAVAAFLYCGATEMFCFRNDPSQRTSRRSESAISARVSGDMEESGVEDLSNNNRPDSRATIRFTTANEDKIGKISRSQNNSMKRGSNSKGQGEIVKKSKVSSNKPGTINSTQKTKGFLKNNKQPAMNKTLIDKNNKLQMTSRGSKNARKWKETSRVASKPLIFGTLLNSKANFPPTNVTVQNLEMLYEGIDKNISTLSTTPNPSGSLTFPGLSSKNPGPVPTPKRNSTEKHLFPSLSHYSSLPLFHLVKFPNGEMGTLGQYSPHFLMNPTQRHTHRHTYSYPHQQTFGAPLSGNTGIVRNGGFPSSSVSPSVNSPSACSTVNNGNADIILTLSSTLLASPIPSNLHIEKIENNTALYASPASTTVRSSTLATIQEESESGKGSPKGPTPGFLSSTGEVKFGGSFSFIHDLSNVEVRNLMMESEVEGKALGENEGRRSEEAVPLGPVCTGEFTPLELLEQVEEPLDLGTGTGALINGINLSPLGVCTLADTEGNDVGGLCEDKDLMVKPDEFEGTLTDEIEETISEIGALAKARASKAQFRLGFD